MTDADVCLYACLRGVLPYNVDQLQDQLSLQRLILSSLASVAECLDLELRAACLGSRRGPYLSTTEESLLPMMCRPGPAHFEKQKFLVSRAS